MLCAFFIHILFVAKRQKHLQTTSRTCIRIQICATNFSYEKHSYVIRFFALNITLSLLVLMIMPLDTSMKLYTSISDVYLKF